ncbi:helix-turn-helix domain-containing protein [Rhodococcus rhodochrous]|uniref:helix-turn-helix domain-containing protein n=1 Tax=Rhodococcus rhodochrous TaxID=1829 RepID=UPI000372F53C|nr:helix-turn-helix transcriptional regulator [Rhodococcus rhodochrous]
MLTIEEVIGTRIQQRREQLGLSQAKLGEMLAATLGKPWSRQAVSLAEKGGRAFVAAELVALAESLDISIAQLFVPSTGLGGKVLLPSGHLMPVTALMQLAGSPASSPDAHSIRTEEAAARIMAMAADIGELSDQVSVLGTKLWHATAELAGRVGAETKDEDQK